MSSIRKATGLKALLCSLLSMCVWVSAGLTPHAASAQSSSPCGDSGQAQTASAPVTYDGSYALLIGMSDYDYWEDLDNVPQHIKELKETLECKGFNVIDEMDLEANRLKNTIRQFIRRYGMSADARNNRLLIYFSGHGYAEVYDKVYHGYLVPKDAVSPAGGRNLEDFILQAMTFTDLESVARRIRAKHALFLIDACLSGSLFESRSLTAGGVSLDTPSRRVLDKRVIQFITAGSAFQEIKDSGLFKDHFIRSITTAAVDRDGDGFVTGTQLGNYLHHKIHKESNGLQSPLFAKLQASALRSGEFLFHVPATGGE